MCPRIPPVLVAVEGKVYLINPDALSAQVLASGEARFPSPVYLATANALVYARTGKDLVRKELATGQETPLCSVGQGGEIVAAGE